MKIILYKKCILSNSYSEVFDVFHKTKDPLTNEETVALQRYLIVAVFMKYVEYFTVRI